MARSNYVYVALDTTGKPVCTATVKYEFKIWLEKQSPEVRTSLRMWRCADGTHGTEGWNGKTLRELSLADFDL